MLCNILKTEWNADGQGGARWRMNEKRTFI